MKSHVFEQGSSPIGARTIPATARWANVSRSKIYDQIKMGFLTAVKCGGTTLITVEEAERWKASWPKANIRVTSREAA